MIELVGVSYTYPDTEEPVLAGLDLSVGAGGVYGVVGASGAGKTTLAKTISGFIPHAEGGDLEGSVTVAGIAVADATLLDVVSKVGLVTQNPFNQITGARFSVEEEIAFGLENLGVSRPDMIERVDAILERFGLQELRTRSPYELSGGQQQLVAIASIMVMEPTILVMDEPTSQLDPGGTRLVFEVIDRVAAAGTTVVLFEHKLELLRDHADTLGVLAEGRIVLAGAPRDVLADARLADWGVGSTRFTAAARAAVAAGLEPADAPLPVSLAEAVDYFGGGER
jgi:energy-coupling factor transporter ATP-binding protein EcfA2